MDAWSKYINGLDNTQKDIVLNTLKSAMAFSPEAVPDMPYGVPGLKLNGKPLIAVAVHKKHYGIYPFSSEVIEKTKPLLGGLETAKGTIRFSYDDTASRELIQRLVELRSQEIE
jgi:uncharacterized protein YdhG (YjbR/CyaY superfamily)